MRIIAGVDCHKASHTVVFVNAVGQVVDRLSFATTEQGYEAALALGERLGCTEWGIEGSGCYGFAFAVFARARCATVLEVPGSHTKRYRRHASQHGKSDLHDAQAIAEVVLREVGRLPHFHLAVVQRALRLRYDQRDRLVRERTRAANRLRSAAILLGVMQLPANITSTRTARRLASLATGFREEVALNLAAVAMLDEVQDAAEEIVRLNGKIAAVECELRPLVRRFAPDLLELHGVSAIVATGLIGHSGDVRNYRSAAAFAMKDRKRAEGKTHLAAMRCLKRILATVVYYRLRAVDRTLTTRELDVRLAPAA